MWKTQAEKPENIRNVEGTSGNLAELWDNFEEIGYQFSDKII